MFFLEDKMEDETNLERLHLARRLLDAVERGIRQAMKPKEEGEPALTREQGKAIYEALYVASLQEQKDRGDIAEA